MTENAQIIIDFESLQNRSVLQLVQTFQNPLKEREKKKIKKCNFFVKANGQKELQKKLDPLSRKNKIPKPKIENLIQEKQNQSKLYQEIKEQDKLVYGKKNLWDQIRTDFFNNFDLKTQNLNIMIFGQIGIKKQQKIKSLIKSQIKTISNKEISIRSYLQIMNDMKQQLKQKWILKDKVGCLQMAIQASKLMHDTSLSVNNSYQRFHAIKFAKAIDIINTFGVFVFQRIKSLSFPNFTQQKLNQISFIQILQTNIPQAAQQICRNWLLKIGSIREVLPRNLIQTSLLRLHYFLDSGKRTKKVLDRLSKSNRCFGQPINCLFYSTFLICVATQVVPKEKQYLIQLISDIFYYMREGQSKFGRSDINYETFMELIEPFFKAAFTSFAQNCQQQQFIKMFSELPNFTHPIILKNLINIFQQKHLKLVCVNIVKRLHKLQQNKYQLYYNLMIKCSSVNISGKQLASQCWAYIGQLQNIQIYLKLLVPLIEIIIKNFNRYQKNILIILIIEKFNQLFGSINKHDLKNQKIFYKIEEFISIILKKTQNIQQILTIQPFLHLISFFPHKLKIDISKKILKTFVERNQKQQYSDPIIVNNLQNFAKNLNDNFEQFKNQQQKLQFHITSQIVKILTSFIQKVTFGKDIQQLLNFYADFRAYFGTIQPIAILLIQKVYQLTIKTKQLAKKKNTKKINNFIQACLAYCYITIPMIQNLYTKIRLYKVGAHISLNHNKISQGDSFIKMTISLLLQLNNSQIQNKDLIILNQIIEIIGFLIVVPDDPENDYLFLFNGLFNVVMNIKWNIKQASYYRLTIIYNMLIYLSCQIQDTLPYHIEGVCSNDSLYKSKQFKIAVLQKTKQLILLFKSDLPIINQIFINDQNVNL